MWLPDDIVAMIGGLAPDPRPLLLTCRQFYAVFTELPDIAYWCSGKNPKWLLPKHFPEVWNGFVTDLIDADNLAVFKLVYKPTHANRYVNRVNKNDAVEICRFLHEKHRAASMQITIGSSKCLEFYANTVFKSATGFLGGIIDGMRDNTPVEILYRHGGVSALAKKYSAGVILRVLARTYPLPEFSIRDFIKLGPYGDDVEEYVRLYRPKITLAVLAFFAAQRNYYFSSFIKLLNIYNDTATVLIDTISVRCCSTRDRDVLLRCGARVITLESPTVISYCPDVVDLYLPENREILQNMLNDSRVIRYNQVIADKCASVGLTFNPTVDTLHTARTIVEMAENVAANPNLIEHVPEWVGLNIGSVDIHGVLHRLGPFSAHPGYAAAVAGVIAVANFEDI